MSVSTAPIVQSPNRQYASYGAQLYQIKVMEDGRPRYRLRLGPFDHEHEANAALATVRDDYPGALTATALPADLLVFESKRPAVPATPPVAAMTAPTTPKPPLAEIPVLTLAESPVVLTAPVPAELLPPAFVEIPTLQLALEPELPRVHAAPVPPPPPTPPARAKPVALVTGVASPRPPRMPPPILETTQTVRALTPLELSGATPSRSFAIQLLLAEEPPDPAAVPHLDLFSEYRLYAVSGQDQGKVKHALRLGFFADEAAANMVASYLSAYYEKPNVVRVSAAEKERFAERRVEARMDVGATGRHAVIEITGDLVARYSGTPSKA